MTISKEPFLLTPSGRRALALEVFRRRVPAGLSGSPPFQYLIDQQPPGESDVVKKMRKDRFEDWKASKEGCESAECGYRVKTLALKDWGEI